MSISVSSLTSTLNTPTKRAIQKGTSFSRHYEKDFTYNTAALSFADWMRIVSRTLKQINTDFGAYKGYPLGAGTAGYRLGSASKTAVGGSTTMKAATLGITSYVAGWAIIQRAGGVSTTHNQLDVRPVATTPATLIVRVYRRTGATTMSLAGDAATTNLKIFGYGPGA